MPDLNVESYNIVIRDIMYMYYIMYNYFIRFISLIIYFYTRIYYVSIPKVFFTTIRAE